MTEMLSNKYKAAVVKLLFCAWSMVDRTWNKTINFLYYDWYNQVFNGCIKEIVDYDIKRVTRDTLYKLSWYEVFLVYFNFMPADLVKITQFTTPKPNHIYQIITWNNKKHLTKHVFNAGDRSASGSISSNGYWCLTCILGGKDITAFVNQRRMSFNEQEKITVFELIIMCVLERLITTTELIAIVNRATSSLAPELYTILDDMTEQIYKDIILIN